MIKLSNKNAFINMKCSGEESSKWTITRALNPVGDKSERVTKILREQAEKYNWEGLDFPTPLEQIETFEKNNNLLVNVLGYNKEKGCVESLRVPNGDRTGRILLMLIDDRYAIVKSISRLLHGQATRRNCKRFYCENCLKGFSSEGKLSRHVTCSDEKTAAERISQRPRRPKPVKEEVEGELMSEEEIKRFSRYESVLLGHMVSRPGGPSHYLRCAIEFARARDGDCDLCILAHVDRCTLHGTDNSSGLSSICKDLVNHSTDGNSTIVTFGSLAFESALSTKTNRKVLNIIGDDDFIGKMRDEEIARSGSKRAVCVVW